MGIIAVTGFAGSSKTEMLALTACLSMAHPDIGKIHCSAPTHVATTNLRVGYLIAKDASSVSVSGI